MTGKVIGNSDKSRGCPDWLFSACRWTRPSGGERGGEGVGACSVGDV